MGVSECSPAVATSFNNMRLIVTLGWAIYPAGYLFGYLLGAVDDVYLNVIYNIADFVNKIAFVLSCWACAKEDMHASPQWAALGQLRSATTGEGLLKADGVAGGFDQGPRLEAANKIIGNHTRLTKDICNPSPKTQKHLSRVSPYQEASVDRMMQEVARRLLGRVPGAESLAVKPAMGEASTWKAASTYLAERTQSTNAECPGRKADMSEAAARAFLAVVKEVAGESA